MLITRGLALTRLLKASQAVSNVRNMSGHAYFYRVGSAPPSKLTIYCAEALGGLAWWWILWHLWHEPGHITGEFDYPNPSKWTDQELGIPPIEDE